MTIEKYEKLLPRKRILERIAEDYDIKGKIVLDIGCGEGRMTSFLVKNNSIIGIDKEVYVKGLISASEKGIIPIRFDIDYELPFKNDIFDVILCLDTIEHIRNYKQLITECLRILKIDGLLIMSTPNINSIPHKIICLLGRESDSHISMFGFFDITNEIKKYFDIIEQTGWSGLKIKNHWLYFNPSIMKKRLVYNTFVVAKKR